MLRASAMACAVVALLSLTACGSDNGPAADIEPPPVPAEAGTAQTFDVERVVDGLNRPTWVGAAPGDDALWVAEQPGRLLRIDDGERTVALDLRRRVRSGTEQGLLGVAFHPDFGSGRRLVYLHWSDPHGDTRVAEFAVAADGTIRPEPRRVLLEVAQPEENHNGGQLAFGPDGRLYIGMGDGGGAFNPHDTAQDLESPLGKLLAADVERERPDWDVILYGLRNPWRFSFDFALGDVWIGDVGQDRYEEIDRVQLEYDEPPKNLGWSAFEGTARVPGDRRLDDSGELIWPVAEYPHDEGCSVTGGVVYRGTALPRLAGRYVYGDFCTGTLWSLRATPEGRAQDIRRERAQVPQLTHIGTDGDGELLFASGSGAIFAATGP